MITEFLKQHADDKYKSFNSKLISTKYKIWGVRLPQLKKFAKKLSLQDFKTITSLEEVLLFGYTASNFKTEDEQLSALSKLLPYIDNWCSCDCVVQALKKLNGDKSYKFFTDLLNASSPWYIRVAIVGLMRYFITSKYILEIMQNLKNVKNNDYYVKMALAWFYAELCVTNYNLAKKCIAQIQDKFVLKKAISKANDSFRLTNKEKYALKQIETSKYNK